MLFLFYVENLFHYNELTRCVQGNVFQIFLDASGAKDIGFCLIKRKDHLWLFRRIIEEIYRKESLLLAACSKMLYCFIAVSALILSQMFYGRADLFIIGQFEGVASTTAVSIGAQVVHMFTVMIVGLAMGTTVSVGQAVGADELHFIHGTERKKMKRHLILKRVRCLLLNTSKEKGGESSNTL